MKSSLLTLKSFLLTRLRAIWLVFFLIFSITAALALYIHSKFGYLEKDLYPLQRNLYHCSELLEKDKSILQSWINYSKNELQLQPNLLLKIDLFLEFEYIKAIAEKYPEIITQKTQLFGAFDDLILQERERLNKPLEFFPNLTVNPNYMVCSIFKSSCVWFGWYTSELGVDFSSFLLSATDLEKTSLINLDYKNYINEIPQKTYDKYFSVVKNLQNLIDINIQYNQSMITQIYQQIFHYGVLIFCIIIGMLAIFTIWSLAFTQRILKTVVKPVELFVKNISNIRQKHINALDEFSSIVEINKLMKAIMQIVSQRLLFEKKIQNDKKILSYLAYYDTDINAHNYHYLLKKIRNISQQISSSDKKTLVLVLFKINNFDNIENLLGNKRTANLLINFTKFIFDFFTPKGEVARVNHTEFALYIIKESEISIQDFVESFGLTTEKLKKFISEIPLEFSVGVSSFPNQAKNINQLLAYARFSAIKSSRERDRGIQYFDLNSQKELIKIAELERDLFYAVKKQQIFLLFQPQIDLRTNKIVGCEALVRWQHPKYGVLPPIDFINIAEKNFEIIDLGRYIQEKAISLYSKWVKFHKYKFKISINASLVEINTEAFPYYLLSLAKQYRVPTSCIEIEITESIADDNFNVLQMNVDRIRSFGFLVAIDDFGTGYSSLERLQKLKVDLLKIDRIFLNSSSNKHMELLKIIFALGHVFETECLIEGVETAFEAHYSKELGIQYAQGYHFYHPLSEEDMTQLLKKSACDWVSYRKSV